MSRRRGATHRSPRARRAGRATAVLASAALLAALATFSTLGHGESLEGDAHSVRAATAAHRSAAAGPALAVPVFVDSRPRGRRVPSGFLGLSFEVSSLQEIAGYAGSGDLVKLLRSLGPGVLRFGGVSADTRVAWSDSWIAPAPWAAKLITPADLSGLGQLASRTGWHVLLTLGFAHFDPLAAAREASAARATLGTLLAGVELGNEPDAYTHHDLRESPWTFAQYGAQAQEYLGAIGELAPGTPLAGPDVSGSSVFLGWGGGEAAQLRPSLLTGHHYPLGCHESPAPTIERLLSVATRHAEDVSLDRYMRVARAAGIGFRLDETNSVSCGGRAGISDTFASALWATSYIARSMAAGVSGINFHGDPANCAGYAPLCAPTTARLQSGSLSVRPEWYALLLTRALIGDRAVRARIAWPLPPARRANLSITALRARDGRLHLVIVDDEPPGSRPVELHLHVARRYRGASILALDAPSPSASAGVHLGGRSVAADGSYTAPRSLPSVARHGGPITVTMSPSSAALLTLR